MAEAATKAQRAFAGANGQVFFPVLGKGEGGTVGAGDVESIELVNARGLSRKHIFDSIKASLDRLQLEYVDVLQCHR